MKSKMTPSTRKKINEAYARGQQKVKGRFEYYANRGGTLGFSFRRYKGPIEDYEIKDGEVRELPLAVAEHLQENGKVVVHKRQYDEETRRSYVVGQTYEEFTFIPVDFNIEMQKNMLKPDLVTVEEVKS